MHVHPGLMPIAINDRNFRILGLFFGPWYAVVRKSFLGSEVLESVLALDIRNKEKLLA